MHKDKTDQKIIRYLTENSRESFVDIGKRLKISESAIRRRVKNMVDGGVIKKFTLEIDEQNMTSAVVFISVDSAMDTSNVSKKLTELDGIKTIYEITGQYDITTIISAATITEINSSIDALRKISGVVDTNTVIILKKVL